MKKSFGLAILLACGATSGASPALAQSFDRNALEDMFGEPVTTSATGQPQRASEVPADMEIVTAEQIRRTGADTLPDVLRFVAGIDVRQYGLQDASVGIRGYDTALNPRVLVLLDGQAGLPGRLRPYRLVADPGGAELDPADRDHQGTKRRACTASMPFPASSTS